MRAQTPQCLHLAIDLCKNDVPDADHMPTVLSAQYELQEWSQPYLPPCVYPGKAYGILQTPSLALVNVLRKASEADKWLSDKGLLAHHQYYTYSVTTEMRCCRFCS